jgi:hypothetical protein
VDFAHAAFANGREESVLAEFVLGLQFQTPRVADHAGPDFTPTQTGPFSAGTTGSMFLSNLSSITSNSPAPTYPLACAGGFDARNGLQPLVHLVKRFADFRRTGGPDGGKAGVEEQHVRGVEAGIYLPQIAQAAHHHKHIRIGS